PSASSSSCGFLSPAGQRVELKPRRFAPLRIQSRCVKSSVVQQLDSSQRRAKPHLKRAPAPRLMQSRAEPFGGVAHKPDLRHPSQEPAFPEDQVGVKMADDGLVKLWQLGANRLLGPKEGQGRWVVAKQQQP